MLVVTEVGGLKLLTKAPLYLKGCSCVFKLLIVFFVSIIYAECRYSDDELTTKNSFDSVIF